MSATTPSETSNMLAKRDPMGQAMSTFDSSRYNLCTPVTAIDRLPAQHRISIRVVQVNPDTETYPIPGSDKLGLSKVALDKLASAANIQWIPGQCGQVDNWNDPYRIKYRAVGLMKNFDGESRVLTGEKVIDLRGKAGAPDEEMGADTLEIIRIATSKKRDPWNQISQARQQINSLAESKAKNRAIRAGLSIPAGMKPADVGKPFIIPALVLDPDMSDPDIKRAAIQAMFGAAASLYGPPQRPINGLQAAPQATGEIIDVTATEPAQTPDPWETAPAEPATPKGTILPMDPAVVNAVTDKTRRSYLAKINEYANAIQAKYGEGGMGEMAKIVGESDLLTADLEALKAVGTTLKVLKE